MRKSLILLVLWLIFGLVLAGCSPTREAPTATPQTTAAPALPPPTVTPTMAAPPAATMPPLPAELISWGPELLSAGDPYAPELGNRGYDVQHYTLQLTLDPARPEVKAQVTISATSTQDALGQIALDFIGFDVTAVTANGVTAAYRREQDKLIVGLPTVLAAGDPFTVQIAYSGRPEERASEFVPFVPHLGLVRVSAQHLYAVNEPDGARTWFPCNDHPRDKATYRFELTVPAGLAGVANGTLAGSTSGVAGAFSDGRAGDRYIWEARQPIATAFVTVLVGQYTRLEATSPAGVWLRHYIFPEQVAAFNQAATSLGQMVDWFSERLGPYPFDEFGYATVQGLGASLETQTMVIVDTGSLDEGTLTHELAHMWLGDWVSLDSWGDIWRSEGFAVYLSELWLTREDPAARARTLAAWQEGIEASPSGYPLNDPPRDEMFGRDSYLKGALLAHALHEKMGDEAFFRGLRLYLERYGGRAATHAEFQAAMEEIAGTSLDEIFAEWFK